MGLKREREFWFRERDEVRERDMRLESKGKSR